MIFEQKEPMCHRLHDELTELMRSFLASFIKHEKLRGLSAKSLKHLDVSDSQLHHNDSDIYIGQNCQKILSQLSQTSSTRNLVQAMLPLDNFLLEENTGPEFRKNVKAAYITAAAYILKKLPLENKPLQYRGGN